MDHSKHSPDRLAPDTFFEKKAREGIQNSLLEELLLEENVLDGESVSDVLFRKGEMKLIQGDANGLHYFELAAANDSQNQELFFSMALAIFHFGSFPGRERYLLKAIRFFNRVKKVEALHPLGCSYYLLGKKNGEMHYFQKAKEIFVKAIEKINFLSTDVVADLFWDNALVWIELANRSGEALDTHIALKSFDQAAETEEKLPAEFWQSYGKTAIHLAEQLNDFSLYQKGIANLKQAVALELSSFECWFDLGQGFAKIFYLTLDEEHFTQATESFTTAVELKPSALSVWIAAAELLLTAGKLSSNRKMLMSGLDKCKRAARFHNRNLQLNVLKARLLTAIGHTKEEIKWIYDSQNILNSIENKCKKDPNYYLAYGETLEALGIYYDDLDYTFQAIEKYQLGLSLDSTHHALWYSMGQGYSHSFAFANEHEDLQLSIRFFKRALHLKASSLYHLSLASALTKSAEHEESKTPLSLALIHFDKAFSLHRNALYTMPEWHFEYAVALDLLGDYEDDEEVYVQAIDILNQVLMVDPQFPHIHHRLAIVHSHLGELTGEGSIFMRALHHYRLEQRRSEDEEQLLLDWGVTLINLACTLRLQYGEIEETKSYFQMARQKLTQCARHGYAPAFFHLGCLEVQMSNFPHAMSYLAKADQHDVLPSYEELMHDEWLDPIREEPAFKEFMQKFEDRTNKYG